MLDFMSVTEAVEASSHFIHGSPSTDLAFPVLVERAPRTTTSKISSGLAAAWIRAPLRGCHHIAHWSKEILGGFPKIQLHFAIFLILKA